MTPEEAREIERLEFEADCLAARETVFAIIAERHGADRAKVLRWIEHVPPPLSFIPAMKKPAVTVLPVATPSPRRERSEHRQTSNLRVPTDARRKANGLSMTLKEWATHLGITVNSLHQRMHRLGSLEAAIALGGQRRHPMRKAGVVLNLPDPKGTGGGSVAQEIS